MLHWFPFTIWVPSCYCNKDIPTTTILDKPLKGKKGDWIYTPSSSRSSIVDTSQKMITWRIVKWCGKTTNGIFAAKRRKKEASELSETEKAQKIDGKRPINWKSIGKTCKLELLMSHSDDSSLFQVVFFLAWSKLPFFHLFGYGRLSSSSLQHLQSNLFYMTCWQRDVQMPIHHVFFKPITNLCYFNFWLGIQLEFLLQEFCFFNFFQILQMMNLPNSSSWISSR